MELTGMALAQKDRRIASMAENVQRFVWFWRMSTYKHQCANGSCGVSPDPTVQALTFCQSIENRFADEPIGYETVCELLTLAVRELAGAPVDTPPHLYVANDDSLGVCSCGEVFGSFADWDSHAGGGLKLQPWQEAWLAANQTG